VVVDGRELEQATVLGEAHALDLVALDGGQEFDVAIMRAVGEVRGVHGWLQGCEEGAGEGVSGRRGLLVLGLELGRWRGGRGPTRRPRAQANGMGRGQRGRGD
jgi:hypothetical protein